MDAESSAELLVRVKQGDRDALDRLLQIYVPALRRWARGRLPRWARDLSDTEDLVQETVVRTLRNLDSFERRQGSGLQAYLREAVMNRIKDECRRVARRPIGQELKDDVPDNGLTPLEAAVGSQALDRYERALQQLREDEREAIVARIEMGYSYAEIAVMLDKPTANAARVAVSRALIRLAEHLRHAERS